MSREGPHTGSLPQISFLLSGEGRQGSGGYGLAVALGLFIRHAELDLQLGEFGAQHFLRLVNDDLAAVSGSHTAQEEQVADIIDLA